MYDNLTKTWNGLIEMRSALHQETMQKFVVPIKLPPEAYIAMQHFHPVQLFMEISKEVNFDQCPDGGAIPAKKAKTNEEAPPPTPFNVVSLDDTLPLPHDYLFPPSPLPPPLVICESSTSTSTSSQWAKNSNTLDWHTPFAYIIECIPRIQLIQSIYFLNVFQFHKKKSPNSSSSNSSAIASSPTSFITSTSSLLHRYLEYLWILPPI